MSDQPMTGPTLRELYRTALRDALRKENVLLEMARAHEAWINAPQTYLTQEPPNGPDYMYKSVEYHEKRIALLTAKIIAGSL